MKVKNKYILVLATLFIILVAYATYRAGDNKPFKSMVSNTNKLKIVAAEERTEEKIIYSIFSNDKLIGEFAYDPSQDSKPLCREFNGDYIIGKSYIYRFQTGVIEKLNSIESESVWDYSIYGDMIATIEKVQNKEHLFEVVIKNTVNNTVKVIDKFKYGKDFYPSNVALAWDSSGKLYYDSFNGEVPVISVYDTTTKASETFKLRAFYPQVSPDGTKMLYYKLSENISIMTAKVVLFDLLENKLVNTVMQSNKSFWVDKYLIARCLDKTYVYIANTGELVQEIEGVGGIFEVSIADNKWMFRSLILENSNDGSLITKEVTRTFYMPKDE